MEGLATTYTKEELREIFEKMDWDKNGSVTPIEFKSYLESLRKGEEISSDEVFEAFTKIDKDGSRNIQWEEFLEAMTEVAKKKSEISEDELSLIFNQVDTDGDGYISLKEARRAYRKLAKVLKRVQDKDAVDKWLENADFDSDGRISIEEFKLSVAGNSLVDDI